MKKISRIISLLVLIIFSFTACNMGQAKLGKQTEVNDGSKKLKIYASFYPMYFLSSRIAGDRADVITMVPAGAEPHDWEPTAKTIKELQKADMFIYSGAGMETWVERLLSNIDIDRVKVVEASKGIELLGSDPHVWVSPKRAKQQALVILNAIAAVDPENKTYYETNYKELAAELDKLDYDIEAAVKGFKSKTIVVSHEAFGYFAKDYGLTQIAIRGVNPEDEPSPAQMAKLVEECRQNSVKYIFFEKLVSPKLSESLANEVGAQILVLNDGAGISEEDMRNGKDYIKVMYENLENLKKALN